MVKVDIERDTEGRAVYYRVTRDFPNAASAAAAVSALERIVPEAFAPLLEQQIEAAESEGELNVVGGSVTEA